MFLYVFQVFCWLPLQSTIRASYSYSLIYLFCHVHWFWEKLTKCGGIIGILIHSKAVKAHISTQAKTHTITWTHTDTDITSHSVTYHLPSTWTFAINQVLFILYGQWCRLSLEHVSIFYTYLYKTCTGIIV